MNTVKIKINPYKNQNVISIGDKPISTICSLSNYLREPILKWADTIYSAIEEETNDSFDLIVSAEAFETQFLEAIKCNNKACMNYSVQKFENDCSVDNRYNMINDLKNKYAKELRIDFKNYVLGLYKDLEYDICNEYIKEVDKEDAFIFLSNTDRILNDLPQSSRERLVIVLSNNNQVRYVEKTLCYIWEIEEKRLEEILTIITDRFVKVPIICDIHKKMLSVYENMEENDKEIFNNICEIDANINIKEIGTIEVGEEWNLEIIGDFKGEFYKFINMKSLNSNVAAIVDNKIVGVSSGKTIVEFYKADEMIPFEKKEVVVYKDNSIKKIDLELCKENMGIGEKQSINITTIPKDATDVELIRWSVDNSEVIKINKNGEIEALKEGNAVVYAETENVKGSINVSVLPNIEIMKLSINSVKCYCQEKKEVSVMISPNNCFNNEYTWFTSDSNVAVVEKDMNGKEYIKAISKGKCTITCKARVGDCFSTCKVVVRERKTKESYEHLWLLMSILTFLLFLVFGFNGYDYAAGYISIAFFSFEIMAWFKTPKYKKYLVMFLILWIMIVSWWRISWWTL